MNVGVVSLSFDKQSLKLSQGVALLLFYSHHMLSLHDPRDTQTYFVVNRAVGTVNFIYEVLDVASGRKFQRDDSLI